MSSKAIKIPTRDYEIVKIIAKKETWNYTDTISKAIRFFAKAKRILKG